MGDLVGNIKALIHGLLLGNQAYEEFDDFPIFWKFAFIALDIGVPLMIANAYTYGQRHWQEASHKSYAKCM